MLLLKGLECLLLLLLAGPARRVSAVLSCSSSGVLLDTSCSQWEDINAVFGIEVDYCSSGVLRHDTRDDCEASAAAINGHADYDGPDIGCRYNANYAYLAFGNKAECDKGALENEAIIQASKAECADKETGQNCGNGNRSCNSNNICVCSPGANCEVDPTTVTTTTNTATSITTTLSTTTNTTTTTTTTLSTTTDTPTATTTTDTTTTVTSNTIVTKLAVTTKKVTTVAPTDTTISAGAKLNVGGGDDGGSGDLLAAAVAANTTAANTTAAGDGDAGTDSSAVLIAVAVVAVLSLVGISVYCWKGRGTPAMAAAPMELVVVNAGYVGPLVDEAGYQVPVQRQSNLYDSETVARVLALDGGGGGASGGGGGGDAISAEYAAVGNLLQSEYAQPSTPQMEDYDTGVVPGLHYATVVDDSHA